MATPAALAEMIQVIDDDIDGGLAAEETDMLAVVGNNAEGSVIDFYGERSTSYDVELGPTGRCAAPRRSGSTTTHPSADRR